MDYPEFRSRAESLCLTEGEKERLSEELELIGKRGWEQYMALFAGILEKVRSLDHHISAGGSISHSYALLRVVEPERDISYRLGMKNGNSGLGECVFRFKGNPAIPAKGERLERGAWLCTNVYPLSPLFPKAIADS